MKRCVRLYLNTVATLLGIVCAAPGNSCACNVPVFRYAIERWPADAYRVVVYDRTGPRGAAFALLQKGLAERSSPANYALNGIDVTKPEGKAAAEQRGIAAYPWVEVYYPSGVAIRTPILSAPLTVDRARKIVNSPVRSRLAQRLLSGDIAVWVLVRSGNEHKDRRARESLQTHLDQASATLRIPDTGADSSGNPIEVADFKTYPVRFSLMEIARNDPDEDLLVQALLKSEPDLGQYDEPMAFPVFGRGRALYALVGNGLQGKNILQACQSMLAWCSCEIKAQNPGTDMLIAADWSRPFGGRMVKDPDVPLTGLTAFLEQPKRPEAAAPRSTPEPADSPALCKLTPPARGAGAGKSPTDPPPPPSPTGGNLVVRNLLYLAGAAGLALVSVSVYLTVKARRPAFRRSVQQ